MISLYNQEVNQTYRKYTSLRKLTPLHALSVLETCWCDSVSAKDVLYTCVFWYTIYSQSVNQSLNCMSILKWFIITKIMPRFWKSVAVQQFSILQVICQSHVVLLSFQKMGPRNCLVWMRWNLHVAKSKQIRSQIHQTLQS